MTSCSVVGCDRAFYAKTVCVMHYNRLRRGLGLGPSGSHKAVYGTGSTASEGYRVVHAPGHPLATSQGKAAEHRVALYGAIGEGPHPCHWCGVVLPWRGRPSRRICVDHLDDDRANNDPSNLVPSCLDCNTKRGNRRGNRQD